MAKMGRISSGHLARTPPERSLAPPACVTFSLRHFDIRCIGHSPNGMVLTTFCTGLALFDSHGLRRLAKLVHAALRALRSLDLWTGTPAPDFPVLLH